MYELLAGRRSRWSNIGRVLFGMFMDEDPEKNKAGIPPS